MNRTKVLRVVLLLTAVGNGFEAAVASSCWHPNEIVAAQVKDFQYLLMVGTLRCRDINPGVETSYGQFVTRHKGTLNSSAIVLKGHFLREIGIAGGQEAYDRFATWLSNRHSGRHDAPSFCSTVDLYARMAAVASDEHLLTMAQAAVDGPVSGRCNPAAPGGPIAGSITALALPASRVDAADIAAAAAAEALPAPAAEPVPAAAALAAAPVPVATPVETAAVMPTVAPAPAAIPVAAIVAAPEAAPVVQAAALTVPAGAVLVADAPIVPPQTVAEPPAAAAAPRDTVRALQDAIKALQAATEALAAQQTTPI